MTHGEQTVQIPTDDGEMPAYLFSPESGSGPGIVLLQEIFGVSAYIRARAGDLAGVGYVVVAPEIYWRLDESTIDESAPDFLDRAMGVVSRLDWQRAVQDAAATVRAVRELPVAGGVVGLVGFCFGGGLAFNTAAVERVDALVSYYGSALPNLLDLAPQVDVPSLHHFGLADTFIPADQVERIRTAVTGQGRAEFRTYPGAGHAFDNPNPMFHCAEAAEPAWAATVNFLARTLPTGQQPD